MYPYLFGWKELQTYVVCIALGIVLAMVLFIKLCQREKTDNKVINFYINLLLVAIIAGFGSAFLFQAVYNWIDKGTFAFIGLTFLGGLIGGVAVFFILYVIFAKEQHKKVFFGVCNNILVCIVLAHSLGRIGCFLAGCCYGKVTDSWIGVVFHDQTEKRIPVQLFEAVFLLALFAVLLFKFKKYAFCAYPMCYGVWRFIIEFFRDDLRGSFVPGLTPSQFQSILLFLAGAVLLALYLINRRKKQRCKDSGEEAENVE